jgi:hypothetical protein
MLYFGSHITSTTYDIRDNPTLTNFGSGVYEERSYDLQRGWVTDIRVRDAGAIVLDKSTYTRSATGRVASVLTERDEGKYAYSYDYAGRLLAASNFAATGFSKYFTYDIAGNMRSNGADPVAANNNAYLYPSPGGIVNPDITGNGDSGVRHTPSSFGGAVFVYDANGNMETGLNLKEMTYDAENRLLSVKLSGSKTCYVYGADGARVKKIEGLTDADNCANLQGAGNVTAYFGPVEIRNFGSSEIILTYPHPSVRLKYEGAAAAKVTYLHRDQMNSVRSTSDGNGTDTTPTLRNTTVWRHPCQMSATPVSTLRPWSGRGRSWPPAPRKSCPP